MTITLPHHRDQPELLDLGFTNSRQEYSQRWRAKVLARLDEAILKVERDARPANEDTSGATNHFRSGKNSP